MWTFVCFLHFFICLLFCLFVAWVACVASYCSNEFIEVVTAMIIWCGLSVKEKLGAIQLTYMHVKDGQADCDVNNKLCQVLRQGDVGRPRPEDGLLNRRRQQKTRPLFSDIWSSGHSSEDQWSCNDHISLGWIIITTNHSIDFILAFTLRVCCAKLWRAMKVQSWS